MEKYKAGLQTINNALSIRVTCPDNPDSSWEKARLMITKMMKTSTEVSLRIDTLQSTLPKTPKLESPPSYEEVVLTDNSSVDGNTNSVPKSYAELSAELEQFENEVNFYSAVIYTQDNVKLYFISGSGIASSYPEPETLTVALTEGKFFYSKNCYLTFEL